MPRDEDVEMPVSAESVDSLHIMPISALPDNTSRDMQEHISELYDRYTGMFSLNLMRPHEQTLDDGFQFEYLATDYKKLRAMFLYQSHLADPTSEMHAIVLAIVIHCWRGNAVTKIRKSIVPEAVPKLDLVVRVFNLKDKTNSDPNVVTLSKIANAFPLITAYIYNRSTCLPKIDSAVYRGLPKVLEHPSYAALLSI